jgi:nucleoside-diphosphate-sugar epimerase
MPRRRPGQVSCRDAMAAGPTPVNTRVRARCVRVSGARVAVVFGGSGQVGAPLLRGLAAGGWRSVAVSREARPAGAGVHWLQGSLEQAPGLPRRADAIFSCGPSDAFARWLARGEVASPRVVMFGSTSAEVKRDSADEAERAIARRLREGEQLLFDTAARSGIGATVLRPTLVYGAGRDLNITRIAQLARRLHGFALPSDAVGLRQPVHVDDLAAAALACVDAPAAAGRTYAVPGGETLPYRDMVARVLAALHPAPRLAILPPALFRMLLGIARTAGVARDFNDAALARMREDLAFDAAPAQRDFGYAPRAFAPTAAMLTPPA